jgi:hypothetical protein
MYIKIRTVLTTVHEVEHAVGEGDDGVARARGRGQWDG